MGKICILTSVHPVTDTRIFIKEAQSLKKEGYDVTLIAQSDKKYNKDGIKIIPLKAPKNRLERIFKLSWKLYQKALKVDADIYHFHDPELIPVGLLLKIKGKKVIYDVHEDVPQQILSKDWIWKPIRKLISKGAEFSEKLADKYLDAIISATPKINDKFNNSKSIIVQNFPLLNELTIVNKKTNCTNIDVNYIAYVGGITSTRGIKEIVEAMELIPDIYNLKLLLAGQFGSENLRNEIQKLKGWEKVEFMGWVSRKEVSEILSKSNVGIVVLQPLERYKDSYPIKMFEYMSASLPVLASDFPLWKEIIDGNNCGINVDPTQPDQIAKGIQYLLDNPEEAKKMGREGRKAVEEKYNWLNEENKLLDLYKNLMSN